MFVVSDREEEISRLKEYFAQGYVVAKKEILGTDLFGCKNTLITIKKHIEDVNIFSGQKYLTEA